MKFEHFINKSLVLVIWEVKENGWHHARMFPGTLVRQAGSYWLCRGEGNKDLDLPESWLELIAEVPPELKALMKHCDYQLSLTADDLLAQATALDALGL